MSSLRTRFAALAFLPALAACELDLTGIGGALSQGFCGGSCAVPAPRVYVTGTVRIGDYDAWQGEAGILVYAPTDTVSPIATVPAGYRYEVSFDPSSSSDVCAYLVRAVLWSGEKTELEPLLATPPQTCPLSAGYYAGADLEFPPYTPLSEPFTVTGRVLIDGVPPAGGAAEVQLAVRAPRHVSQSHALTTDDQGIYRFETTDRAQWWGFCQWVEVDVEAAGAQSSRRDDVRLFSTPTASCTASRKVPDVRIGAKKAAWGRVLVFGLGIDAVGIGSGVARVALLSPADSSVVGEVSETYDDGSFHVWFPPELQAPGCNWLLRTEVEGGPTQIRPLHLPPTPCQEELYHEFVFDSATLP